MFADVPHLIKLIRNHFLDTGYMYKGKFLTSRTIAQLLLLTSVSDASISYKLTEEHLTVHHAGRQKVKLAVQLFSHNTASAIRRCYGLGHDLFNATETAEFISVVNDWFDVFNRKFTTFQSLPTKKPFGMDLLPQMQSLANMDACMQNIRARGRQTLLPFQKGILMCNNSLRGLFQYLKERHKFKYILTYRLNQDIIEHFFGAMRSKGGLFDSPSPMHFKYRLRKYLLGIIFNIVI